MTESTENCAKIDIRRGVAPQEWSHWQESKFDVVLVGYLMYLLTRGDCCGGYRGVEHGTGLVCARNCGSSCSGRSRSRAHKARIDQGYALLDATVDAENDSLDLRTPVILGLSSN